MNEKTSYLLIKRLFNEYIKKHTFVIIISFICMGIVAASTASITEIIQYIVDDIFVNKNQTILNMICIATFVIFFTRGIATFIQTISINYIGQKVIAKMQKKLFEILIKQDLSYFHNVGTGTIVSKFTIDVQYLRNAIISVAINLGKDLLTVILLTAVMFNKNFILSTVAVFVFFFGIRPIIKLGKRVRKVSDNSQTVYANLSTIISQSFQGIRLVKAYNMEAYENSRISKTIDKLFSMVFKTTKTKAISTPIVETLAGLAIGFTIYYGGKQVFNGELTPGQFMSFIVAFLLAYEPVKKLAKLNANLQEGLAAADRIFKILDLKPEIKEHENAHPLITNKGQIHFQNVSFKYDASEKRTENIIENITATIPSGKKVALVGASGAGKSTLMNLIPRFYDTAQGKIEIDGFDIRHVTLESLRKNIALVSQDVILFDDTIKSNISFGNPEATMDEIIESAKNAAAHGFISQLPDGYDTVVGEQGVKLSGGQKQRIAIARAMIKDAPILLLDEATSALDSESEVKVEKALKTLMQGRTTIVIAHRLSTIIDSDIVYVMDKGRIVEQGTHNELILRKDGVYQKLYSLYDKSNDLLEIA